MTVAKPSRLSDQRLARLSLWLALTAAWFAAQVLGAVAPRAASRLMKQHARDARLLIVARAVKRLNFRAPRRGPVPVDSRRHTIRRVAGAALRRALRKGPGALCAALAASEHWIATVARRLQRGLTKLRRLPQPRRVRVRVTQDAPLAPLRAADTS